MALRRPNLLLAALALAFGLAGVFALASPPPGEGASSAAERRPDLVQRVPRGVQVRESGGRFQLGFDSAVSNRGDGPLLVDGHRGAGEADMSADQLVRRSDGTRARVKGVGVLRYVRSGGHDHWHALRFDRYELRRASDHGLLAPDHKTGFCLGDRYDTGKSFPNKPSQPVITTSCFLNQPQARSVQMGISVGYGDDYRAYLEGQSIDITGIPAGEYVLVHRVNGNRALRETRYSNNASSVLLRLRWPNGTGQLPAVEVLARCAGEARCAA